MAKINPGDILVAKQNSPYRSIKPGDSVKLISVGPDFIVVKNGPNHYRVNPAFFTAKHEEKKIVITTDGKKTTARLYEDGKVAKTGQAVCSDDDEFNFETGALLSMIRMSGVPLPKSFKQSFQEGDFVRVVADNVGHGFPLGSIVQLLDWDEEYEAWKAKGYSEHTHGVSDDFIVTEKEVVLVSHGKLCKAIT